MKTNFKILVFAILLFIGMDNIFADGLVMSADTNYPGKFLRNRVTEVSVTINGLIAETVVYQEFINDWNKKVNGVYSFPLPDNARSTMLLYARNDTTFKAVLKIMQQSPNPGTGQGGIVALLNKYLGRNGLKMELTGIAPGAIQKVELHYISILDYHRGKYTYTYPLNTQEFITNYIDHLELNIDVKSNSNISQFNIPSHPDFQTLVNDGHRLVLKMQKPMAYLAKDIVFTYQTDNSTFSLDSYSVKSDSMDSHFAFFVRPENIAATPLLNKKVVFLLSNSSSMVGYKLDQSKSAISQALDLLTPQDYFNIITYNSYVNKWSAYPLQATLQNIQEAKNYLNGITGAYGNRLDLGLQTAISQFEGNQNSNSIIAFTDGRSAIDPRLIKSGNVNQAGIFPVGLGDDIDRARLEMTASLNYGFVTYLKVTDDIKNGILQLFEKISNPIVKSTIIQFEKPDISGVVPQQLPSIFAGSYFFVAGRYLTPGTSAVIISGQGASDTLHYNFNVNFSESTSADKFPEYIWAKEVMDSLEREIEVYGETVAKKDTLIKLSLKYGMRCRYTAYFADYTTIINTEVEEENPVVITPATYIASNYPNPFNPSTMIRIFIAASSEGKYILLKVYNLLGQLIRVIDISSYNQGWHEVLFDGKGLSSGIYFVTLEVNNHKLSSHKIIMTK